jgi:hypothetical protein
MDAVSHYLTVRLVIRQRYESVNRRDKGIRQILSTNVTTAFFKTK